VRMVEYGSSSAVHGCSQEMLDGTFEFFRRSPESRNFATRSLVPFKTSIDNERNRRP